LAISIVPGVAVPIKEEKTFVVECAQVILAVGQAIENPEIFEKIKLKE
jgi:hypothetical protein